jgi:hypothetical protein
MLTSALLSVGPSTRSAGLEQLVDGAAGNSEIARVVVDTPQKHK